MIRIYKVPGKWVLCGEHAVVRNGRAIVFPFAQKQLSLHTKSSIAKKWNFTVSSKDPGLKAACETALAAAEKLSLKYGGKPIPSEDLVVDVDSSIPVSAGLGSSAALSVAITHLFRDYGALAKEQIFAFAKELENIFHGTSSGLDVAACTNKNPILFDKKTGAKEIELKWTPRIFLHDSQLRSKTSECVQKVSALNRPDVDLQMECATNLALSAITEHTEEKGLKILTEAIILANACYDAWNLLPPEVVAQMNALKSQGALACKPTGSGNGGFFISLWPRDKSPSEGVLGF